MKSVIVLDLDATLVNTFGNSQDWIEVEGECRTEQCHRIFNIESESGFLWGAKRPHIDHFLDSCFKNFDIVGVWSAGSYVYVNEIVVEIFKKDYPDFVWSKNDCIMTYVEESDTYVRGKPLVKLWHEYTEFDQKRTLLIDDAGDVCAQNPLNHVLVPPWTGKWDSLSKPDTVLLELSKWFDKNARNVDDFRTVRMPELTIGFHSF